MLVIRKAPPYIAKTLCERANIEYDDKKMCYAAREEWTILGFALILPEGENATVTFAEAVNYQVLDGVVRAAIAGAEDNGAKTYDFDVPDEVANKLLSIGFRKSPDANHHSIEKLFSVCKGCSK